MPKLFSTKISEFTMLIKRTQNGIQAIAMRHGAGIIKIGLAKRIKARMESVTNCNQHQSTSSSTSCNRKEIYNK